MAPTTSDEFEGDDFSNNLFSDLAPLLTLFGEQVTKQFLSMSISWADNFLLAMGPLGIITIIVSTIRVGGGKKLKALIGRARESHSVAEQELLTSTSQNVCEMWSGEQIVRLIGNGDDMETCVVTRDGDDGLLKFSRLNKKDYSVMDALDISKILLWKAEASEPPSERRMGTTPRARFISAYKDLRTMPNIYGVYWIVT
ncbi:hypothetical protein CEP53_002496 [Fusarium sp. AF-6]|nr:hypothetical protein CEP53_002496 [Fusarium sp. AF-6]